MRIVDVCAFYTPFGGGVRTYVESKLRAAPALGHEQIVIAPGDREEVRKIAPGAILATIPGPTLAVDRRYRYFDNEKLLHRTLDRWNPDHVEASSPWASASMVGRWQGSATRALVVHSDPLSAFAYRWLGGIMSRRMIDRLCNPYWNHLRLLDRAFDVVVAPSRQLADRLRAGGISKAIPIPLGVDRGRFHPDLRDEQLRSQLLASLGLPESSTLLIGVGRFSSEKRWDMVIRAVADAARKAPVGLLLVGDGPRRQTLDLACARFPNIELLMPITDRGELARLLASADALVHGCEAETFGLTISEARASGIPVIVPNRGGAGEQLTQGAGLAYRAGSEHSLTQAILAFIERDPAEQRRVAVQASQVRTMDEHFRELFACYTGLAPRAVPVPAIDGVMAPAAASAVYW
jgi:alpha-1,6-mannosyltransferase